MIKRDIMGMKKITWAVTILWDRLQERDMPADFDTYSTVKLNQILRSFYASAQHGEGQPYIQLHSIGVWNTASNFNQVLAIIL